MISKIKENISSHKLLDSNDDRPVVVGISGGADSVALLYLLVKSGYRAVAAHCNYGLRGLESDGDEDYVRHFCSTLGVTLEVMHADVSSRMARDGSSLEMACRDIRYEWFEKLRLKYDAQAVAVAHHQDDKAETVMLNMLRGTGIRGLASMKWHREPGIIRPLLNVSRAEIKAFLADKGIRWRDDSSNARNDVKRNKLRNIILPRLYEEFPDAKANLCATSLRMDEYAGFIADICSRKRKEYVAKDGSVNLTRLADCEPYASLLLWEWFGSEGMSRDMADKIVTFRDNSGARYGRWYIDHGTLRRQPSGDSHFICMESDRLESLPIDIEYITDRKQFKPVRDYNVANFDESILNGNPQWLMRGWQQGDRIRPFGMLGTKLVSDVFSSRKLGNDAKESAVMLLRNDTIVWIPGIMNSAEFTVKPSSSVIIKLSFPQHLT